MIDKEYESFIYKDKGFSLQSKLAGYRKEIEAQMQAEMNTQVHMLMNQKLYEQVLSTAAYILKGINALWCNIIV